jgi:ADP-ribosylglycohydrolase
MTASGCLFGLAYGDALGKPTEFLTVPEIQRLYGPAGPRDLTGNPALVTDDTQMTLAVGRALLDAPAFAEEALATALLCALRHADDPVSAIARAATTSGDSDSLACLAGAFHGAAHGMTAWPVEWLDRIEYAADLAFLGRAWD